MPELKPNINSLSKVLGSTPSSYTHSDASTRTVPSAQGKALSLTVVSVNDTSIVLKPENSTQSLHLDKSAIKGLSAQHNIQSGDTLTLISNSSNTAIFHLEKTSLSSLKQLPAPLIQALAQHWNDIPTSALKKAHPDLLSQVTLAASSPLSQKLGSNIIDIASKLGQPKVSIERSAVIKAISANSFVLHIDNKNAEKVLKLTLPATPEFLSSFKLQDKVMLTFDANMHKGAIADMTLNKQISLSNDSLKLINQYLHERPNQIKPLLANLVIDEQSIKPKTAIILNADTASLSKLNSNIKQKLLSQIPSSQLTDAKIVISSAGDQASASTSKTSTNNPNLQLMVLAKPTLVNFASSLLEKLPTYTATVSVNKNDTYTVASNNAATNVSLKQQNQNVSSGDILRNKLINSIVQSHAASSTNEAKLQAEKTLTKVLDSLSLNLKQTHAHSEGISKSLPTLLNKIQELGTIGSNELKQLISNILQNSKTGMVNNVHIDTSLNTSQGTLNQPLQDPRQYSIDDLRQVFTEHALPNLLATNVNSAPNQTGSLVNGLVTMLQASLMAKLAVQQPQLSAQLVTFLPLLTKGNSDKQQTINMKTLVDLHRSDPKGELIAQLNKVLGNHSMHKLAATESTLQGQDSFYYALPNLFSPLHKEIELVIKREQQNNQQNENNDTETQWRLSMKLDIGKKGEVLAKVKLLQENIDLHLYASNEALKSHITNLLPLLQKRLSHLGLKLSHQCYVGKIPESLYKTKFQVVQAYV